MGTNSHCVGTVGGCNAIWTKNEDHICVSKSRKRSSCDKETHPGISLIRNVTFLEVFPLLDAEQ